MKTDSTGLTEYFDDSMKPLHWYSETVNGQLYCAHETGKKMRVYDANLREVKRRNFRLLHHNRLKRIFFVEHQAADRKLRLSQRGFAIRSHIRNKSADWELRLFQLHHPEGQWSGTSQQIGNFTYHIITGPDGQMHTGTTQRIGDFVYTTIQ